MAKERKAFSAQNLTVLLGLAIFMLIGGTGAAFYFGLTFVQDYSVKVEQKLADADASGNQSSELQALKTQLAQSSTLITKADQLFTAPDSYQSQTLTDIGRYASAAGVSIASTTFEDSAANVTLSQPVSYSGLIIFLENIESNLPKMQVTSIALNTGTAGDSNSVSTGDIKITIAVK